MAPRLKIIRIPRTPPGAYDKYRPISDLVRNQVRHAHEELHNWWRQFGDVTPERIATEQEAAEYVRLVTRILHPEGAMLPAMPSDRRAKSGVWLGPARVAPRLSARPTRRPRR